MSDNNNKGSFKRGARPDFIIIGAMKAGTSSLHHLLKQHADIYMSHPKELDFFSFNLEKGVEWYERHFVEDKICGEASPNYSKWEDTPHKIHQYYPDIKLIYILRNPVDRFISQCNHHQLDPESILREVESGDFSSALNREIFTNGQYRKHIINYLKYFSGEQMHICFFKDLKNEPKKFLNELFDFLKVSGGIYDWKTLDDQPQHVTKNKQMVRGSLAAFIVRNFRRLLPSGKLKSSLRTLFYRHVHTRSLSGQLRKKLADFYAEDMTWVIARAGKPAGFWNY